MQLSRRLIYKQLQNQNIYLYFAQISDIDLTVDPRISKRSPGK